MKFTAVLFIAVVLYAWSLAILRPEFSRPDSSQPGKSSAADPLEKITREARSFQRADWCVAEVDPTPSGGVIITVTQKGRREELIVWRGHQFFDDFAVLSEGDTIGFAYIGDLGVLAGSGASRCLAVKTGSQYIAWARKTDLSGY